ncbi:hypothetical protein EAX61_02695 [Dokdonia sinensis]|uniref:CopG family transcriptional regulator n=1 Tax=Dokdonia sinensis TaxID=2479847 RepID=A0A3M0GGA2_9FLAO|nr:hypothetical protein [Dokdonia sinensis]RMB63318.1 hypothetical protein EAX61_02695 [Dokdonia sinensis]
MSKKNLKEKLAQYILDADENALNYLNEAAVKYDEHQKILDKMIEEGEEDIAAGRIVSHEEVMKSLGLR